MRSRPRIWVSTVISTFSGSPTKPRSTIFSMCESGSTMLRLILRASTILPSLPDRPTARSVDEADDLLIDGAGQHHLDDLDRGRVGDAQPGRKFRLDAQPVEHVADLRPAAMHDDRVDGGLLHQHD